MNKQILEAPNYQINEKGEVTNIAKGNVVFPAEGKVRLYVNKTDRKSFKVSDLLEKYHGKVEEVKTEATEVSSYSDFKKKKTKVVAEKKPAKVKKEGKSGADLIREAYDKDPEGFDVKAFSKESGISYGRVYGCIKKYKNKQ